MVLHFVRNVGAGDVARGWSDGFARNGHAQSAAMQERIAAVKSWNFDVKSGQRLIFSFKPGTGVQVTVNGAIKGAISGDDFARAFLSVWLGVPPNPEVKAGLLGGACN